MERAYLLLAGFRVLALVIPLLPAQHWPVRWFDFIKVHLLAFGVMLLAWGFRFPNPTPQIQAMQALLLIATICDAVLLARYTPLWRVKAPEPCPHHSDSMTLLSANVLQFNTDYGRFIDLVKRTQADLVLTMESNEAWDTAMKAIEVDYPHRCKVPLENTYGMHLYSKLKMSCDVHYLIADDLPSIEAKIRSRKGYRFTLFCVHPPPPSPTEEPNSKERDGELLAVAKKIRHDGGTTLVVGDFNNVAWSRSSVLFRKTSETIDPRIGRGLYATFHAQYRLLRFPIDQLFHSPDIFIEELGSLPEFGSDHLPLFARFYVNRQDDSQEELVEELEEGEMEEVEELIEEGIQEEGDRDEVATE